MINLPDGRRCRFDIPPTTSLAEISDPFASGNPWWKMSVRQTGLYRLTGSQLQTAGIPLGTSSAAIRIFNGGGLMNEPDNYRPRPEFKEIALNISDGGDGAIDAADYVEFYGESVDRWVFPEHAEPYYADNVYTTDNVYWLTITDDFGNPPTRMAVTTVTSGGAVDTTISTYRRLLHTEQDHLISEDFDAFVRDYFEWFWTDQTSFSLNVSTPNLVIGDSTWINVAANTAGIGSTIGFTNLLVNNQSAVGKSCTRTGCTYFANNFAIGSNLLAMTMTPLNTAEGVPPYLNYVEVGYLSRLAPVGNELDFALDSMLRMASIQITNSFGQTPVILDLADTRRPTLVTGWTSQSGQLSFDWNLSSHPVNRFYAVSSRLSVANADFKRVIPTDLRAAAGQTDLIIVTQPQFTSALNSYVAYRQQGGYTIRMALVGDIMDNFSYGLYDPTAIRDFLKFTYEQYPSPAPSGVLFVGDGNYDFQNILGQGQTNYVPPYIRTADETSSDDNYVYFGEFGILDGDTSYAGDRGYDMMTARWPVKSTAEIQTIIGKIRSYESASTLGSWRNRIVLVADDEYRGSYAGESFHTTQTEFLEKNYIPKHFVRNKIYAWDYPFVNREKPAVNDAIVNAVNNGALIVNYVGHGNPELWAHESIFRRSSDLPRLHNADRLPLFFAASCDISLFDDPERQSMGEDLFLASNDGAIGVVSANRIVYSQDNADFNREVFGVLLDNTDLTMCEAIYAAKLQRQYPGPIRQTNDQKFVFFGDPLLKLAQPQLRAEFTQRPDTLVGLAPVHVSGQIVDGDGNPVPVDGQLQILAFDSDRNKTHTLYSTTPPLTIPYKMTGPQIFRGPANVVSGLFDFSFVTPLDITYGGNDAQIVIYAILDSTDAVGLIDTIQVATTISTAVDSVAPAISFYRSDSPTPITSGSVTVGDTIRIAISDLSGINLTGSLGHGISAEIDGELDMNANLTDNFEYTVGDFSTGEVQYSLAGLTAGRHEIKIKAWDNANNSSSSVFSANITDQTAGSLANVLNYPNPMMEQTTFYFDLNAPVQRFTLDIFTLAGRKIRSFSGADLPAASYPNASFRAEWDGTDLAGDRVASGVYIYRAVAEPQAGGEPVESFGKVVVIN